MKRIVVYSAVVGEAEAVQKINIYIYIYNKKYIIFHQAKKISPSKSHKSLFIK